MNSYKKKIIFSFITIVLVLVSIETLSYLFVRIGGLNDKDRQSIVDERYKLIQLLAFNESSEYKPTVLHPYIGFVRNIDVKEDDPARFGIELNEFKSINRFGFLTYYDVLKIRPSNEVLIAVMGGSVAQQLVTFAAPVLLEYFKKIKSWQNRKISIVPIALGGYKQPQQLMALNYLHSLGANFDMVINVDGFNEVALPTSENFPAGVHLSFPRGWRQQLGIYRSRTVLKQLSKVAWVESARLATAEMFNKGVANQSNFLNLVWKLTDINFEKLLTAYRNESLFKTGESQSFELSGPLEKPMSQKDVVNASVAIWFQSAIQMDRVARANTIPYFHFLQPNQYDPDADSKIYSDEEKEKFINKEQVYRVGVKYGYPLLKEKGRELVSNGVKFQDLTKIFGKNRETIYSDDCCHYNQIGNEILARAIGKRVVEVFNKTVL
jgi:hypothetical protein